jgi:hypothetical protein
MAGVRIITVERMNLLLQPDPADPARQLYDHPADQPDLAARLAELARLGWRPVGKPERVVVDGRRHTRYRLVCEPRADDSAAAPCQHGGAPNRGGLGRRRRGSTRARAVRRLG